MPPKYIYGVFYGIYGIFGFFMWIIMWDCMRIFENCVVNAMVKICEFGWLWYVYQWYDVVRRHHSPTNLRAYLLTYILTYLLTYVFTHLLTHGVFTDLRTYVHNDILPYLCTYLRTHVLTLLAHFVLKHFTYLRTYLLAYLRT